MSIAELFLLAVGLSMDAFAVSICKGLSLRNIKVKHMLIAGAWFGGFQALMPTVGYVLGSFFADLVSKWSHWIAFVLLLFIGGSMIKESFGEEEEVDADMSFKVMFLLAVATSIDALAVGVSFAFPQAVHSVYHTCGIIHRMYHIHMFSGRSEDRKYIRNKVQVKG